MLRRLAIFTRLELANQARPSLFSPIRQSSSTPAMITEKETIKKLLYNIGSRKEVEQYLRMFSSVESHQFAIIKVI